MTLRFSNRHFHRLYHRNLHHGSTGSLSVDHLDSAEHRLQLHLQLHRQKSDSNNNASAEASSESINPYRKMLIRHNNIQSLNLLNRVNVAIFIL